MELLVFWLLCGVLAAAIASSRGGSGSGGMLLGLLLGPFGIAFAFFLGGDRARADKALRSGQLKKCPQCAELVQAEARICKHCHSDLPPDPLRPTDPRLTSSAGQPSGHHAFNPRIVALVVAGSVLGVIALATLSTVRRESPAATAHQTLVQRCATAQAEVTLIQTHSSGLFTNPEPGVLDTPPGMWQALAPESRSSALIWLAVQNACARHLPESSAVAVVRETGTGRVLVTAPGGIASE